MNKVLVTGGAGFIGYHLAEDLAASGSEVTICDNLFRGKADKALDELISLENIRFIHCDLTVRDELRKLGRGYDHVYHLAAINGTRYFYEIPHTVLRVNILCVLNVLDWFVESNSKKILFASSSETYAGTARTFDISIPTGEDVPLIVDDIYNPRSSYGGSKIVGELLIINYARAYGFEMSIVRYHNVYGPRMGYEHVIPEFCARIKEKQEPFKIYGGEETRAFCYIADAVQATKRVMESPQTNGQIVHVGNDREEISILRLAQKMFSLADFHPTVEILPAPEGSVRRRCPDINKLKTLTGFQPQVSLNEGLRTTMEWYIPAS